MDIPFFIYLSSADGHSACFHFLDIMNNVARSSHKSVFVGMYVFISLGCIPRIGSLPLSFNNPELNMCSH